VLKTTARTAFDDDHEVRRFFATSLLPNLSWQKSAPDEGSKGISLLLVEATRPGITRGRNLDKIGQCSADTSELFFSDVRIPATHSLGAENKGFSYRMTQLPEERLSIAICEDLQLPVAARPSSYIRSMIVAGAIPPAAHSVANPTLRSRRSSSSSRAPRMMAPVAPIG
jgi:hypothetical protein